MVELNKFIGGVRSKKVYAIVVCKVSKYFPEMNDKLSTKLKKQSQ